MSANSVPPSPLDALWQGPAMVWVLLAGEGLAVVLALAPGVSHDRWVQFGLTSLFVQWISLLTLGELYVVRGLLARLRPQQLAYIALALLLLNTWGIYALTRWLGGELWPAAAGDSLALFFQVTGIVLTVGALGLAAFQNHWRGRIHAVQAKQSELMALQARIRPHFLFNTLNTGAALVHLRPEEAERLLLDLADLFRAALAGPKEILLTDELGLARRYLEIEGLRFGDRLQVRWQLPPHIPDVMVPSLSIQPLVENAVRHGVEHIATGGVIDVAVSVIPGAVIVRISNPVTLQKKVASQGHHVGLNASQVRISALTGGRGSVKTQLEGDHFVATVRLPTAT